MRLRRRRGLLALVSAGLFAGIAAAGPAEAAAVPYDDFSAAGSIGFCDQSGHAVTGGSVDAKPFVWKAVGSARAPAPYDGPGRKATLVAYQPRPKAYPNQWSGDTLTASTSYSNPGHPTAVATFRDFSLRDFMNEFPPLWDGLVQLRLYYGVPNQSTWTQSYAATDIKITGSTWTVVDGASVPCNSGTATSTETVVLGTASPTPPPGSSPSPTPTANSASPGASSVASGPVTVAGATPAPVALTEPGSFPTWAIGLVAVAIAAGAALFWWRRRGEF